MNQIEIVAGAPYVAVAMFTAPNPGSKTLEGSHSYVVGHDQAYVIDPGPDIAAFQEDLASWIQAEGIHVAGILLSHDHPDHAPGASLLAKLLGAPVWASSSAEIPGLPMPIMAFGAETSFQLDGDVLYVLPAPGHSPDHVVFWLENSRILFSGDTVLGRGTSVIAPPAGDMKLYLETLSMMRDLGARIIAPGHGAIITHPNTKIDQYIAHRQEREEQIVAALKGGPKTVAELVNAIYADVDRRLHGLAAGSVEAHLLKLEGEGRVRRVDGSWDLGSDSRPGP